MSRSWLFALPILVVAVGAAYALGFLGGDDAPTVEEEALRREADAKDGPTGPMRHEGTGPTLAGLPDAAPEAPPPPRLRAATVRVVDEAGIPLAGRTVSVFVGKLLHGHYTTDANGWIRVPDLPADGEAFVALGALDERPAGLRRLGGDALVLEGQAVLTLRVDVVDGETGGMLGGARWYFTTPELRGGVEAIPSGTPTSIQASPAMRLRRPYAVETPPDYVDWDEPWEGVISRYATSLEARHPLRREMDVSILVKDDEDEDVRDAQIHAFHVAGRGDASPQLGRWMLGGFPLEGVPFFPGQTLRVWAKTPDGRGGEANHALPAVDHGEVAVEIVVKKGYRSRVEGQPWGEEERNLPFKEYLPPGRSAAGAGAAVGGLEVEVIRADGRPATGARVHVPLRGEHRTDETGVLRIAEVLAGDHPVVLDEPGLVTISEPVTVVAGEVTRVTLNEPVGATLVVTVKGVDGKALPFAQLRVGQAVGSPWADLAPDGVQRLDPYTDERGRRTLRRVQPGRIRLDGRWGGWKGTVIATVGDRQTKDVTLLLR